MRAFSASRRKSTHWKACRQSGIEPPDRSWQSLRKDQAGLSHARFRAVGLYQPRTQRFGTGSLVSGSGVDGLPRLGDHEGVTGGGAAGAVFRAVAPVAGTQD